jgi:hypothetical protein
MFELNGAVPQFSINKTKTMILPFVLCGCEIWSVTIMEECSLRVFQNRDERNMYRGSNRRVENSTNEELEL